MSKFIDAIIRTASLTTVLGAVVVGSLFFWQSRQEMRLREELAQLEAKMAAEIAARDAMIARLSRSFRKARLEVLSQETGPTGTPSARDGTRVVSTTVRFIELDDAGHELGRREFTVPGDTVFVDAWTARFPKEVVAEGNPLRDRTLVLFRRLYSDRMSPVDGLPIDTPGAIPDGYAASQKAKLEQAVWAGFWKIASDPEVARQHGVAVAQGEAVYKPVRPGEVYDVMVDAAAGLSMTPAQRTAQVP
ncbi:MAG: hypothetical protein U0572_04685 [Phycisphaerales bacterium]